MDTTIQTKIKAVQHWRHRITFPDGSVTPGSQDTLLQLPTLGLPDDLAGKSVLDIGCSDGFFSFECEKRGASRVVAVDDFSSVYVDAPNGFKTAREILGSKVEFVQADLLDLRSGEVGTFDLVLFLGVLYHLRHPLLALERLVELCRGQIILETAITPPPTELQSKEMARILGHPVSGCSMTFLEGDEAGNDPTNWWVPTPSCVEGMMRSVGFCAVKSVSVGEARGVFHGFAPSAGSDVDALVERVGPQVVGQALKELGGKEHAPDSVRAVLRSLSAKEFGVVKQRAHELKAKHWHQIERWR